MTGAVVMPSNLSLVRKYRAPKGALRPERRVVLIDPTERQKASSAKRCIKTHLCSAQIGLFRVKKHRAPKGALRRFIGTRRSSKEDRVRKHRAPTGALILVASAANDISLEEVRKHRAPKGALRLVTNRHGIVRASDLSESTERQKVH